MMQSEPLGGGKVCETYHLHWPLRNFEPDSFRFLTNSIALRPMDRFRVRAKW